MPPPPPVMKHFKPPNFSWQRGNVADVETGGKTLEKKPTSDNLMCFFWNKYDLTEKNI
jgi:hypothetical protein